MPIMAWYLVDTHTHTHTYADRTLKQEVCDDVECTALGHF
jgi:hypothetical protein